MVSVMDLWTQVFLIALIVITYVIGWKLVRPLVSKIAPWMISNRSLIDIVFSIVCVLWGASIWYLIVTEKAYGNTLAIVMASILLCTGIYYLAKCVITKR
jgi:hypothetical protein